MLLYPNQLFEESKATFSTLHNSDVIKCKLDLKVLARFSANLKHEIFNVNNNHAADMPVQLSSMDFTMHRIAAYKAACTGLKVEDKRQKNMLGEFGVTLQRNLFYGKE